MVDTCCSRMLELHFIGTLEKEVIFGKMIIDNYIFFNVQQNMNIKKYKKRCINDVQCEISFLSIAVNKYAYKINFTYLHTV